MQTRYNCFQEYKKSIPQSSGKLRWLGNFIPEAAQTQNRKSLCAYGVPLLCVRACVWGVQSFLPLPTVLWARTQNWESFNWEVSIESQWKLLQAGTIWSLISSYQHQPAPSLFWSATWHRSLINICRAVWVSQLGAGAGRASILQHDRTLHVEWLQNTRVL